jgi:hypothetical protein
VHPRLPGHDRSQYGLHRGRLSDVYNKLFIGNNLPSMTLPGEQYRPEWTEEELGLLRASIEMAVDLICSRVVASGWRSGPA